MFSFFLVALVAAQVIFVIVILTGYKGLPSLFAFIERNYSCALSCTNVVFVMCFHGPGKYRHE
jgi:hypothetical protein